MILAVGSATVVTVKFPENPWGKVTLEALVKTGAVSAEDDTGIKAVKQQMAASNALAMAAGCGRPASKAGVLERMYVCIL